MKLVFLVKVAAVLAMGLFGNSATQAADAGSELKELVEKVKTKLQAGKTKEEDLGEELKAFDALLEAHRLEKTDEVAQILYMKATLYAEVFENEAKATELMTRLQKEFPGTGPAKSAEQAVAQLAKQAEATKIQKGLAVGSSFPDFTEKDMDGKPLSLAQYKGKVVLLDFWATWCGPCVAELPNVKKTYDKFHSKGFEIVGISLDQDKEELMKFLKEEKMSWPQYFDGLGWQNKVSTRYGINSIPATYLLDAEGKILAKGLRGDALETAVEKALAAK